MTERGTPMPRPATRDLAALAGLSLLAFAGQAAAEDGPPPNDSLNAILWTQNAVEFKASALGG